MDLRRFDVFLSYDSSERETVGRLAQRLRQERIELWWDRWALTGSTQWQPEIVTGLEASRTCAVVIGPKGLGRWAREELAVAQDRAVRDPEFRIFMVLLPGAELSDPSLAFLRTRTWVDLREGIDDPAGMRDLLAAVTGKPLGPTDDGPPSDVCPYRGLETFDEQHARFFFGRQNDVALALERLKESRYIAVLGPSGSGKSSLVRAGVIPALRHGMLSTSESWTIRVFTPGPRPAETLAAIVTRLFPTEAMQRTVDRLGQDPRTVDLTLSLALAERPPQERVVLVADQFEEVFTVCRDELERRAFIANLAYAATVPGGRVIVVVGMRADFFHRCAPYPELRAILSEPLLVGPLDAQGMRRAITDPAAGVGLQLQEGLADTILADVGDGAGTLPLLEHLLLELWHRRKGGMLTLAAYVDTGGVLGAVEKRADAVYADLSPPEREVARLVLLRLVQPGDGAEDTRRRTEMNELLAAHPTERDDVEAVVKALADQRLLTIGRDEVSGHRMVEIAHEALIRGWPRLRAWIHEDRDELRAQRLLTEASGEWHRSGRRDEDLYSGARLAYWNERDLGRLTDVERDFVAASQERERRERGAARRRVRIAVGGVGTAITIAAIVALVGLRQVTQQRDVARSRQLAAEATATLPADPGRGLQLALEAFSVERTRESDAALRQALSTPGARVKVLRASVHDVAFSPDGRRVATAGFDYTVRVWDWAGDEDPVELRGHEGSTLNAGVFGIAFSPDGRRVASAGRDGTVRVWDWAGGSPPVVLRGHEGAASAVAFSPDGQRVASAGDDGTVRIWAWAGGEPPMVLRGHDNVNDVAFSPDGTRLASGRVRGRRRAGVGLGRWNPARRAPRPGHSCQQRGLQPRREAAGERRR